MITLDELRKLNDAVFNRAVAGEAGYRDVRQLVANQETYPGWYEHELYDPGGGLIDRIITKEECEVDLGVPDYANDLNAAWALKSIKHYRLGVTTLTVPDNHCEALVNMHNAIHDRPARALATAWFAWKRSQESDA